LIFIIKHLIFYDLIFCGKYSEDINRWRNMGKKWFEEPIAVFDVETTGLDPQNDRIIEIAILHYQKGVLEKSYVKLVDPKIAIPEDVKKRSGISDEDVISAESFEVIACDIAEWLKDRIHVAYNLPFDRGFIRAEINRAGLEYPEELGIDPLIFARGLVKEGRKKLSAIAERLGIQLDEAHRAKSDAEAAAKVLFAMKDKLPEDLDELITLQAQWAKQQDVERAVWRKKEEKEGEQHADFSNLPALGPAYIYGNETDPLRAMFLDLPASGTKH
jgi:DNA polymerase III epsilon subunit family exonuclease